MKKLVFLYSAILAVLTWGCQNEDLRSNQEHTITLNASVATDDGTSRVGFDRDGKFFWSKNDKIGVVLSSDQTYFTEMVITSGTGTGNASFSCESNASDIWGQYAVYPHHLAHKLNGNILTYHIDQYHYIPCERVESDFFALKQGQGESFNMPMYAEVQGQQAQFKHLGGVLCLKVGGLPANFANIQLESDQKMYGDFEVDLSQPTPELKTSDGHSMAEFNFDNRHNLSQGIFYLPVPTGTYHNVKLHILTDEMQELSSKDFGTVTVGRRELKVLTNIKNVTSTTEASSAIEQGETLVSISGNSDGSDGAVEIVPNAENASVNLFFTGVRTKTEIKEKAGQKATQAVNINVNDKQSGELIIDLPHSTVNLVSVAPAAFTKATVRTADNTLEIGSGTSIDELIVKGGSVIVHKGANVKKITKDTSEGDFECNLYVEYGATFDAATVPAGINLVSQDNCVQHTAKAPNIRALFADVELLFAPIVIPDSHGDVGICYSATNAMPTVDDNKTVQDYYKEPEGGKGGSSSGNVTRIQTRMSNLSPKTVYYYRTYCAMKPWEGKDEKIIYGAEVKTLTTPDIVFSTEEYVDLGLNNVYWGNRNLGATQMEDLGNDYYWGAKTPSKAGDDVNVYADYLYDAKTKILKPEYDAANIELGNGWRMPTNDELWELQHSCAFSDYELNGKPGCIVMGPNGKAIFLPKKHYNKEEIQGWNDPDSPNKSEWYLSYWTSERATYNNNQNQAYCLTDLWIKQAGGFGTYRYVSGLQGNVTWVRNALYNIRPVKDK